MSLSSRCAVYAALCTVLFACESSSSSSSFSSSRASSTSSSSPRTNDTARSGGGGCGGGLSGSETGFRDVSDAPDRDPQGGAPSEPAPTGMGWKPVETDEGCGRSGLRWVLVDEVCGDGEGADPRALETPMFRDGAIVGGHMLAVDGTHLWSLDLADPARIARASLVTGLGQPLAAQARGSTVYLAAGYDGLVLVDAADPTRPSRGASLKLPSPAFDVDLRGDAAYLAVGKGGIAAVDVSGAAPALSKTYAVPGHAAGVTSDDAHLYVAACTSFSVLDRATGAVRATVPFPRVDGRLFTAAKDVAIVGDVAFVAAGRQGVVAIDVTTRTSPVVLGRCTIDDPKFYASGVRAKDGALFVAGGEWGVLRVDLADPKTACMRAMLQAAPPEPAEECSSKPPWEVVDWERVWAPAPPAKDPIQVLPDGDRVFAFGDARRIGVRAIDVRHHVDLTLTRRYDEPRALLGVAARGARVVTIGPRGGVFQVSETSLLERVPDAGDQALTGASAVGMLDDGRWVALVGEDVRLEGRAQPLAGDARAMAVSGASVAVSKVTGQVEVFSAEGATRGSRLLGAKAALPLSIATTDSDVFYAAPEWTKTIHHQVLGLGLGAAESSAHEIFDDEDAMDLDLWRQRVPRRHLATSARGLVDVAVLGRRAGLALHPASGAVQRVALPALTYAGVAADADHAYAIALDRGLYRSYLVTVALAGTPRVVSFESFTGAASGVAASGGRVYVSDADGLVRVYQVSGDDVAPLGAVRVEERP